ncbi:hypothetical protein [Pseudomonas sp. NPDC089534]|uniref:hypothetical protein n=1 Tax=Pseudomonas sp. NPDC089534 TaxID=3364468 RepID=UPI0037FA16CD
MKTSRTKTLLPPVIDSPPLNGITGPLPQIAGTGVPGYTVTVINVDNPGSPLNTAPVDTSGRWSMRPVTPFGQGLVTITASQSDGNVDSGPGDLRSFNVVQLSSAPAFMLPESGSTVGPATLLLGTGVPNALVEVWAVTPTEMHLGNGYAGQNGRWLFNAAVPLPAGLVGIRARQTLDGSTSPWSSTRQLNVNPNPVIPAPQIDLPKEGAQTGPMPELRGQGSAGLQIDLFDLQTDTLLATTQTNGAGAWFAQPREPLRPGRQMISVKQREGNDISDWALLRTFEVPQPE